MGGISRFTGWAEGFLRDKRTGLRNLMGLTVGQVPARTADGFGAATTAHVPASAGKRYVDDAQLAAISGVVPLTLAAPALPPANGYARLVDTTTAGVLPVTEALPTPGALRGHALGREYDFEVLADQALSAYLYVLDGAGVWQLMQMVDGSNSIAIPANTLQRFVDIYPCAADTMIVLKAGATPPTVMTTTCIERGVFLAEDPRLTAFTSGQIVAKGPAETLVSAGAAVTATVLQALCAQYAAGWRPSVQIEAFTSPVGGADSHDFLCDGTDYQEMLLVFAGIGATSTVRMLADGSEGAGEEWAPDGVATPNGTIVPSPVQAVVAQSSAGGNTTGTVRLYNLGARWFYESAYYTEDANTSSRTKHYSGYLPPWNSILTVSASVAKGLTAAGTWTLYGVPKP